MGTRIDIIVLHNARRVEEVDKRFRLLVRLRRLSSHSVVDRRIS